MSEYIEIETELDDDGETISFQTNLSLASGTGHERYESHHALAEGSPVAQVLAGIEGIDSAEIRDRMLMVTCTPGTDRYAVAADVNAALKDFFL